MEIGVFGIVKDIVGNDYLCVEKEGIHTVGDLRLHLTETYPKLKALASLAVAVNREYATDDVPVLNADEIVLIPPVSGG